MNAEGHILDSGRSHLTPALPHPRLERRFVLTTLLPPALLRSAAPFLWEHDLLTAADITGPDGRTVLDWASLWGSGRVRQRLGRAPSWFPDFLRAICEPTLFEANLMSPPYVEGQFAWHPQGYLTRIVSKWEERDEDDGRLRVYVRLEHWIWRDRTIRDGDGEGAARFYKCTMLKDECDARYTTDDATAKAARQRCDHSEPESGACQWTEDSIHIHPARLLELITPATRTRKHEPYAVVKLESQEWWTEFRTTLFLPPWERDWDYEADPSAQPQPPSGYKQRRPGTVPPRTAPPVYPDRQPLEHFLIDPEPLADPFWNLVAQELRREELPAARPREWRRPMPAQREDDAPQAAALRELAEAIPTDGSDFFVAPCPGTVNNNKGELLAVLTAFLKSPEGCTVKTDSSTAMSLIRRSVLHRADSTSPRRRRRKATRREPETDSDADDSGSYVSYLSAPDDLPPSPLTPSLSPNSARDKGSHPSNVRPARRAGRNASAVETRSRLSGPTFPPSPASRSPNAWRGGARPAPLRPVLQGRSRSRIRPRRLGCRKTCMASTASLEGYDSSRAYRVESDPGPTSAPSAKCVTSCG
eukprot:tig00020553_g10705.t2